MAERTGNFLKGKCGKKYMGRQAGELWRKAFDMYHGGVQSLYGQPDLKLPC